MKKGILFLVLTLSLVALQTANFASANELTDDYFDIATNYFNSNNCPKALEYLDLILKIEPDNLAAKTLKTKIATTCPDNSTTCPQTVTECPQTATICPDNLKVAEVPAETSVKPAENAPISESPKQTDAAKSIFNSDYYNSKGQEFYLKKDYDNAIDFFYKAITIDKKNVQAYNNLAMAYSLKNNYDAAIKYFKKANAINKNYTQPLVNLSILYKQIGNKQNQIYYLKKAIKCNPSDYLAYYWIGEYYKNEEKYPQAIENYKEVVKINPKFSQAYLNLATSFFETEQFNYALIAINQYEEYYPNSDFAFYLAARTYLAQSNYVDAKTNIEKAIELNNSDKYQLELAKIDYYLGDYTEALTIFQNILKSGDSAEIFNYMGLCNYKLKNIDPAMANFNRAIDLDGLRPIYYYNLTQCYKSLGDKKNYAKYVTMATKINPISYQDFIDLSYIYFDNGNASYAINSLNNAISKYPDVKSLYLSKLKIYEAIGDNLHYNETKDLIEMRFNRR